MPFTPYHLGPPIFLIGLIALIAGKEGYSKKNISIYLSILGGSIIPDIQGFYAIFFDPTVKLHGFSHTIFGSISYAIIFSILQVAFHNFYLKNDLPSRYYLAAWFFSITIFHIIPDMVIYPDMMIFYPYSNWNYGSIENYRPVANILTIFFLMGLIINLGLIFLKSKREDLNNSK